MLNGPDPQDRSAPGAPRNRAGAQGERTAVLLVDDRAENLFALEAMLRHDQIDLLMARSGPEALELLLGRSVALALIDVQMPEMDGFELATLMRGVERTRHVPIIFVTAGSNDQRRVFAGYEAGAVDFLFKPIDAHVLRGKVDVFVTLERQRQELRRSEARFRTLVQATSQAVWRLAADGRVLVDSPSFRELTGMTLDDWQAGRWLETAHPEDRERVERAWRDARATSSPYEIEYRLRQRDGTFRWTAARVAPLLDESGQVVEWVGANADIHARREAEALRELFVGVLGHDLRNPLGAMLTSTQLALRRTQDEAIRKPLSRVMASGGRMARMIEQLLDMTRVRLGGGVVLAPVLADLRSVVDQALEEMNANLERFRVEAEGDTKGIWDVDRLFQIILNLASNALQHGAADAPVRIRIDGNRADSVELSVHNRGPAVAAELQPVIFEAFRGSADPTRPAQRGLGLGLFISKELTLAHGGSISVESSDETGTTFVVRLPRNRRAQAHRDSRPVIPFGDAR